MRLDIRRIFELEGDPCGIGFGQEISLADLSLGGMHPFPTPLRMQGQVLNRAGIVTLSYQLEGVRHCRCDRCLKEWEEPFCQPFEHTVVRRVNNEADEDEFLVCPQGFVDLEEMVHTDVVLSLPPVQLCREDCRGLCPRCGKNLNEGDCGCSAKEGDPRLQVLRELLS